MTLYFEWIGSLCGVLGALNAAAQAVDREVS